MEQLILSRAGNHAWQLSLLVCLLLGGCSGEERGGSGPAADVKPADGPAPGRPLDAPVVAEEEAQPAIPLPPDEAGAGTPAGAALLAELVGDDPDRRRVAREQLDADPPAAAELVDVWLHGDPGQRRGAAFYAMGIYRGDDPQIEDAVVQALEDPDARVRGLSLELVRHFPLDRFTPLLDPMLAMLEGEADLKNRAMVARLLAAWPVERGRVEQALAASVRDDPASQVRSAALVSIYRIGEEGPLLELLQEVARDDADPALRRLAIARLGRLGSRAADAAALVAASLEDEDEGVSDAAARTLTLLGPTAVAELVRTLQSRSDRARRLACYSLGTLGMAARPAIPALEKLLEDPQEDIQELAAMAIRKILLGT